MAYSPDKIASLTTLADRSRIFMGMAPEMSVVSKLYGPKVPELWIEAQLTYVNEFVGVKEKLSLPILHDLSRLLYGMAYYLKLSELMLFFAYLMSGRYGVFYGNVDPLVITTALRRFLRERNNEIEQIERQHRQRKMEEEEKKRKGECVSYEEYKKRAPSHPPLRGGADKRSRQ